MSRPVRDFVGRVNDSTVPIGQHRGAPEPWVLGVVGSSLALGLRRSRSQGSGLGYR
jgi:hypothetical protein